MTMMAATSPVAR
ncbi:hypothetical protein M6B38_354560 [Iris pallida]|uniref:Uncharacterized protein n=1 Tax=Iris pallida TaxID=29817 RepID=A0AAX6GP09_IRIPA|nr:hypothetical protein M6B38_354560 [Iris pallida]